MLYRFSRRCLCCIQRQRLSTFNPKPVNNIWGNSPSTSTLAVGRSSPKHTRALLPSSPIMKLSRTPPAIKAPQVPFSKTRFNQKPKPLKLRLPSRELPLESQDFEVSSSFALPSPQSLRTHRSLPRLPSPMYLEGSETNDDAVGPPTSSQSSSDLLTFKLLL